MFVKLITDHNIYSLHSIYTVSSVVMTRQHWSGHLAPGHQRLGPALTLAVRHETAPAGTGDTSISAVKAFLGCLNTLSTMIISNWNMTVQDWCLVMT